MKKLKSGGTPNTAAKTKNLSRRFSSLPDIQSKVIPHKDHRYETVGDYWNTKTSRQYRVSSMKNASYEFLVLIHEMVEHHLCENRGITEESIMAFDEAFEAKRKPGNTDEPGFDPAAPYRNEHKFAERIEFLIANELGIDWQKYCKVVESL